MDEHRYYRMDSIIRRAVTELFFPSQVSSILWININLTIPIF